MTWIAACSGQRGTYQETIMTDEERQKQILQRLGQLGTIGYHDPDVACKWILDGHDEIERLAGLAQSDAEPYYAKNINAGFEWPKGEYIPSFAQSNAEPVAWQYRVKQGGWGGWHDAVPSREEAELCVELGRKASGGHLDDYEIRPLYAAPPRPDASAGLIEAAEIAENYSNKYYNGDDLAVAVVLCDLAKQLRARAADRSGK